MASKDNTLIIVIGIFLLLFLLGKTNFLASIIMTYENNEPNSIDEFRNSSLGLNGTFTSIGIYELEINNVTTGFVQYSSSNVIGELTLIDVNLLSCKDIMVLVGSLDNTSKLILLNQKKVLLSLGNVYWCNNADNVLIKSLSIEDLSNYDNYYITYTSKVIEDNPTLRDACTFTDGVWVDTEETCVCPNDTEWNEKWGCVEETETSSSPSYSTSSSGSSSSTTYTGTIQTNNIVQKPSTSRYDIKLIVSAIAVIIILFTLYWMFEKGPDKGFIQSKRNRRRKKK